MSNLLKSKKEASFDLILSLLDTLQCPMCGSNFDVNNKLTCLKKHSFDLSKSGYLNLTNQADDPHYTKQLFEHRHEIMANYLFYKPLVAWIEEKIMLCPLVLDAGTGEGSLLNQIQIPGIKVGLDLSKQGIQTAAKYYRGSLWMVADLAKIPFKDKSLDAVLSILSPANYKEFKRVLKKEAHVIKVLPGQYYFKELRDFNKLDNHDNSAVIKRFQEEFPDCLQESLNYKVPVDKNTEKFTIYESFSLEYEDRSG